MSKADTIPLESAITAASKSYKISEQSKLDAYTDALIKLLKENLKPNAQIDFLVCDHNKPMVAFLDISDVCMNADIDDHENKNRGGIVFTVKEDLTI